MFFIGVDLGKQQDFTAIAIAERDDPAHAWMEAHDTRLGVRYLERVALGTPYTVVARRVAELVIKLQGRCEVAVDATGLGAPVVDVLREAGLGCELSAVVMTSGEKENRSGNVWRVPKRDLIGRLQMMLEKRELQIARKLREAGALVRELVDLQSATLHGGVEHDDLVMAVALACWQAGRPVIGYGTRRLPGI